MAETVEDKVRKEPRAVAFSVDKEQALVERIVAGDKSSWDEFVRQFTRLIYHAIYKTLQGRGYKSGSDLVDDLHQEVFLSLLKNDAAKLRGFQWRNGCSLATWLTVVSRNTAIDFIRRDSRYKSREVSIDAESAASDKGEMSGSLLDILPASTVTPDKEVASKEAVDVIRKAITELPPQDRKLLELLYFEDWSPDEVARFFNKTVEAVYMQKKRASDKLKAAMLKKGVRFA